MGTMDDAEDVYEAPKPPAHLHHSGMGLWHEICAELELEEEEDAILLALLAGACAATDREAQARRAVRNEGAFLADRRGRQYPHPGLAVERQSRAACAAMLAQLRRAVLEAQKLELGVARETRLRTRENARTMSADRRGGRVRRG